MSSGPVSTSNLMSKDLLCLKVSETGSGLANHISSVDPYHVPAPWAKVIFRTGSSVPWLFIQSTLMTTLMSPPKTTLNNPIACNYEKQNTMTKNFLKFGNKRYYLSISEYLPMYNLC